MATISLPADPTVGHFRRLARRLQRAVRAGDPEATALAARYGFPAGPDFPLSAAQLVVARECGFSSWPALRRQLELLAGYRRDPDAVPAVTDPADDFCRLACLVYSAEDGPDRWAAAAALLAEQPDLPARSVAAAAAAGDPAALATHLADPAAASAPTGPYGWEPLLYLTYSRVPQVDPLRAAGAAAGRRRRPGRRLRLARADPAVHRADRLLRRGRAGPAAAAPAPALDRAGPAAAGRPAPTPTTGRPSTTGCSSPATTTSSCCSRTGSAGRGPASGGTGSAARWRRRPRCWPGR